MKSVRLASTMAQYSIKELEELSGIKAHTIRIWEKRYGLLSPRRTTTNIRQYSDEDLKRVMNVSLLNNQGIRISKIASLSPEDLSNRVTEISRTQSRPEVHIERLIVSMIDLDEESLHRLLNELIHRFGFEKAVLDIIYPFLQRIGVLWLTGHITPIQEHFISNLLRQKILVAIDQLPVASKKAQKVILFLPEGELHELGLLFSYYLTKKAGFRSYYMGQSVPDADVKWFCRNEKPLAMITNITVSPVQGFVERYVVKLCKENPGIKVMVGGPHLKKMALKIPSNLLILQDAHHLKTLLSNLDAPSTQTN